MCFNISFLSASFVALTIILILFLLVLVDSIFFELLSSKELSAFLFKEFLKVFSSRLAIISIKFCDTKQKKVQAGIRTEGHQDVTQMLNHETKGTNCP